MGVICSILSGLICVLLLAIGTCWLIDRFNEWYFHTPGQQKVREREQQKWRERLANPRYEEVEAHTGFPVPQSLREFYAEPGFLDLEPFQVPDEGFNADEKWTVRFFLPLDTVQLTEIFKEELRTCLPFASDDDGHGYYYLPLELCTTYDGPVFHVCDSFGGSGFETTKVASSLRDFLARREPIWEE